MVILLLLAVYTAMFVHTYRSFSSEFPSKKGDSLITFVLVVLSLSIAIPYTIVSIISYFKEDDIKVSDDLVVTPKKEKDPLAKYENPYVYVPDDQE